VPSQQLAVPSLFAPSIAQPRVGARESLAEPHESAAIAGADRPLEGCSVAEENELAVLRLEPFDARVRCGRPGDGHQLIILHLSLAVNAAETSGVIDATNGGGVRDVRLARCDSGARGSRRKGTRGRPCLSASCSVWHARLVNVRARRCSQLRTIQRNNEVLVRQRYFQKR
jgi:hypothetical protein